MQISSVGSSYPQQSVSAPAERAERGPENDKDSDDSAKVAASPKLSAPPPGRGGKLDVVA